MRILTLPRFTEAVYQMSEFIRRLQERACRGTGFASVRDIILYSASDPDDEDKELRSIIGKLNDLIEEAETCREALIQRVMQIEQEGKEKRKCTRHT